MTKITYTENLQHMTDAGFRSWAQNLSNALQSLGLTKTADSGQIDLVGPPPNVFSDNFNRTNGAVGNGWTTSFGTTTATIDTNQLRVVAGASGAFVNRSLGYNGKYEVKITSIDKAPGLYFRASSLSGGGYRWQPTLGTVIRLNMGAITVAATQVTHTPFTPAPTDVLSVVIDDNLFVLLLNGVEVTRFTDSTFSNTAYVYGGVYEDANAATGSTFDDFVYTPSLRPGSNVNAGYEIYAFPAVGSTPTLYMKVVYGTGSSNIYPHVEIQFGTATSGAGALTGLTTTSALSRNTSPQSPINGAQTYACLTTDGNFFLCWGSRSNAAASPSQALLYASAFRPQDDSGTVLSEGIYLISGGGTALSSTIFTLGGPFMVQSGSFNGAACYVPPLAGLPDSAVGLEVQVFRHWWDIARTQNLPGIVSYLDSDIPPGATFSVSVVPNKPRTYLALGSPSSWSVGMGLQGFDAMQQSRVVAAVIWED